MCGREPNAETEFASTIIRSGTLPDSFTHLLTGPRGPVGSAPRAPCLDPLVPLVSRPAPTFVGFRFSECDQSVV